MATLQQVQDLVKQADPNANVASIEQRGDRIFGSVRSEQFGKMSADERTAWINKHVRRPLGGDAFNVGAIVAMGPQESLW